MSYSVCVCDYFVCRSWLFGSVTDWNDKSIKASLPSNRTTQRYRVMEASRSFHSVSCLTDDDEEKLKHAEKLEQVRDVVMKVEVASLESLQVVDIIKRLGLCYLFQDEIHAILHHHFLAEDHASHHLYEASLRFRLLRQHGYCVNSDEFFGRFELMKFNGEDDLKGVMALHEASHLNMGGEEILHEAAVFTSRHLSNSHSIMAKHCLLYPQHKTLPRFTAKFHLDQLFDGGHIKPWESLLQELAQLEFANIQSLHKHEILQVVEWWKGLRLGKDEVKSWRNEPMKWHMWSIATLENPRWSKHRILLTRPISLVYAVDDIFDDISGTIHDLTHFTEAVTRWDLCATEELPSYMITCFNAIYDTTNEISSVVCQEFGWNPIQFLKEEWGSLMDAFLKEAKWLRSSGEMGINAEEYLKNGVISSGVPMVLSHLYFMMGNPLTDQTHALLNDPNGLTHSVAKLLRLLDDLATAREDEQEEGYDGSYVEMCVKEGKVESVEGGRDHVMEVVLKTWEKINEHGLSWTCSSPSSPCFRQACLNAARMVPTMYTYDLDHALPLLHHYVKSMFQDQTFAKSILG